MYFKKSKNIYNRIVVRSVIFQIQKLFSLSNMSIQLIIDQIGLSNARYERVNGGDINTCWRLQSGGSKYFLKINSAADHPGMFQQEAKGLEALKESSSFIIPAVIKTDIAGKDQFLLLEWLEKETGNSDHLRPAGEKLATLHLQQQNWFGWIENNYIGSLRQVNNRHEDWHSFYADCRIIPLVKQLSDNHVISQSDTVAADKFCLRLTEIFPSEPASLLHGDLWSGNYMSTAQGPSVFDPAVYYGHREMDIGMTKLFGGFDDSFYKAYEGVFHLEKGWLKRLPYSQLYPLLVHAVLFGGHYIEKSISIIKMFRK